MTRTSKRDPYARTIIRVPERPLSALILDLVTPLLEARARTLADDEARRLFELAIATWNAHVMAEPHWQKAAPLAKLRKESHSRSAPRGIAEDFDLLSARYRALPSLDPRIVASWSLAPGAVGGFELTCVAKLPEGVEAYVPPPAEKRIAIGGRFLDEVTVRVTATSSMSFPVERHRGAVGDDGAATIYAQMPTALGLFAAGVLKPVGGDPVHVRVGLRDLGLMRLRELRCGREMGAGEIAVLVFQPAHVDASR